MKELQRKFCRRGYCTPEDLVAITCHNAIKALADDNGFTGIETEALSILSDITLKLMFKVALQTDRWKELAGRNECTLDDLFQSLEDFKISPSDLTSYMINTRPISPPLNLPEFPVKIKEQPSIELTNAEKTFRKENDIPDFLPPIWPPKPFEPVELKEPEPEIEASKILLPSDIIIRPLRDWRYGGNYTCTSERR